MGQSTPLYGVAPDELLVFTILEIILYVEDQIEVRMDGWIKLHRKILESSFSSSPTVGWLFIHLLLRANRKQTKMLFNNQEIIINEGQLITGRKSLSATSGLSEQQIRTGLTALKSTNTITIKTTNKFSVITILNWKDYQDNNQQSNQPVTNKQPASNQPVTTNKNIKNERKKEEYIEWLSFFNEKSGKQYQDTKQRHEKFSTRREKYSVEDIRRATASLLESPFHTGRNDSKTWYASPDFILRSDEQIDKWLNAYVTPSGKKRVVLSEETLKILNEV